MNEKETTLELARRIWASCLSVSTGVGVGYAYTKYCVDCVPPQACVDAATDLRKVVTGAT